jgi:hypothetical protein
VLKVKPSPREIPEGPGELAVQAEEVLRQNDMGGVDPRRTGTISSPVELG